MASIIPDKQLFIVTSALNPNMGIINREDRLQQTIDGLKSLREKCPDAFIMLAEGSPEKVEQEKIKALADYVDIVADFSSDPDITQFAANGRKSEAENVLMLKCMFLFKQDVGMMKIMESTSRIYKCSARTIIDSNFNVEEHDHWGKYVFKKRMPTWLSDSRKEFAPSLLITRLFSFCPSLIDDYIRVCKMNINMTLQTGIDTEHAHFVNIYKDSLYEIDTIHCRGIMAGTGLTEIY